MRILVTGGAGFIGSQTVAALLARGDSVVVLDALTQPVHPVGARPAIPAGVRFVQGDVRDRATWESALDGIDAVIHCAAYQDYLPDFSTFFSVNAAGTALLYEVAVARRLPLQRVVIASSQSVYGEGAARCAEHGVVAPEQRSDADLARGDFDVRCPRCGARVEPEATPEELTQPRNAYGISKLAAETLGLALGAQHGIPTVALRYAIVHGAGQSPRNAYSGLLRSACLAWRAGRAPAIFEDGAQLRDYIAIDDVVAANLVALDHPDAPGRAYNVGGARSWSVTEVLDALARIVPDAVAPVRAGRYRVGDVRHTIGDLTRLRGLGWEPVTDLTTTWKAYWEWFSGLDLPDDLDGAARGDMEARDVLRAVTGVR